MEIKTDVSESDTLTLNKSASALGVNEFSLYSRIQAGDITCARLRSGEIAIPISEVERLSKLSVYSLAVPPDNAESVLPDARLGIKRDRYSGLRRAGEYQEYSVPGGDFRRFTESEMQGYRAAFSAIAPEFESLGQIKKQLDKPDTVKPSSEKEICTSKLGVWQVRSTMLNLGQSDILLCQKGNDYAVMERFRDNTPYAKANGNAEILLEGNDPRKLMSEFEANAKHTLEFMASNQVATAQKVVWGQYREQRPERLMAAISERCRSAVSNEETISQSQTIGDSNSKGQNRNRGMSI
ncbi:MAG TPA: hypothetical protein VFF11_13275 [Candidatus Binatia bacterium]|nr:hypothetical protein [Candidatus Binatia bacterium]